MPLCRPTALGSLGRVTCAPAPLAAQDLAVDLTAEPWRYPGPPAPGPGVLLGDRFAAVADDDGTPDATAARLDAVLRRAGAPGLAGRHAVMAVGSNAAPGVLAAKLRRGRADAVVPLVRGRLCDVAVGHSAHVSRAGYVAAAPYRSPGARTDVVVALLTGAQVRCLDATEPNYVRRHVAGAAGVTPAHAEPCSLYVSRRGVLSWPGHETLPLRSQARLWAGLRACGAVPDALPADHRALAATLAADAGWRAQVGARVLRLGLVRDAGLGHRP